MSSAQHNYDFMVEQKVYVHRIHFFLQQILLVIIHVLRVLNELWLCDWTANGTDTRILTAFLGVTYNVEYTLVLKDGGERERERQTDRQTYRQGRETDRQGGKEGAWDLRVKHYYEYWKLLFFNGSLC